MAKKIDWVNHIIELITVVIGILLAFALNNFNKNKKDESRAFQYMEGIKNNLDHLEYNLIQRYKDFLKIE